MSIGLLMLAIGILLTAISAAGLREARPVKTGTDYTKLYAANQPREI